MYETHNWVNGEVITATKLNSMENGVGENNMSYEKHTWETGELITAEKLNHMEEGIEGGGSLDLHPKITMNVTVKGNSAGMINNALIANDGWAVIQGNNFVTDAESLGADNIVNFHSGDTKVVTCVLPLDMGTLAVHELIPERGQLQTITFSNCVNCTGDNVGGLSITDSTQDASADVTLTFKGKN